MLLLVLTGFFQRMFSLKTWDCLSLMKNIASVLLQKKSCVNLKVNVDTLTLTATPIPRTLNSIFAWGT